jgi:hypothetical protein
VVQPQRLGQSQTSSAALKCRPAGQSNLTAPLWSHLQNLVQSPGKGKCLAKSDGVQFPFTHGGQYSMGGGGVVQGALVVQGVFVVQGA